MNKFITYLRIEGKMYLRSVDSIFFGILMPMGIMLLIGAVSSTELLSRSFAALCTVGVCATAFMSKPIVISDYRDKKILKHFFVTPIRPTMILTVHTVIQIILCIVSAVLVFLTAKICFGYTMKGNGFLFCGAFLLVTIAMHSIGMLIASVCSTVKTTNVVTTAVYFPMLFLSGATIPFEIFPTPVQTVAKVLPLTQGIELLKGISLGQGDVHFLLPLTVLVACTIIGVVVSAKTFRWQ